MRSEGLTRTWTPRGCICGVPKGESPRCPQGYSRLRSIITLSRPGWWLTPPKKYRTARSQKKFMPQTQSEMAPTTTKRTRGSSTLARKKVKDTPRVPRNFFTGLSQTKTGMPGMLKMTHRYTEATRLATTAGGIQEYLFAANGLYDPNITGAGHQPMFFDQISAMYLHYTVLRSKISVQFVPVVASAGCQSIRVALCLVPSTSAPANLNAAIENPRCNWVTISHLSNTFGPQNKLSLSWDAKKIFGANALDDPNLSGTPSSNPTEISYYAFQFQDLTGAGIAVMDCSWTLEFETQWDEPALMGTS